MASLLNDPNLRGYQVASTFPGDTLQPTSVYFGKTKAAVHVPVMGSASRLKRQEEYVVEVHIDVTVGTTDVTEPETTAFAIMGELDNILATNPLQSQDGGSTFVFSSHISGWEDRPYYDDTRQGWAVLLTVQITVGARLQ
jgi:hypothetical protein